QGNTHRGQHADDHTDIYHKMNKQDAGHTVSINPVKGRFLSFGQNNDTADNDNEQDDQERDSDKRAFLAYGAEHIIGVLFGHKIPPGLGSLRPSYTCPSTTSDGNHALVGVIANAL